MRAWHVEAPGPVTGHPMRLHPDDETPRPGPGELLLRVLDETEGVVPGHARAPDRMPWQVRVHRVAHDFTVDLEV